MPPVKDEHQKRKGNPNEATVRDWGSGGNVKMYDLRHLWSRGWGIVPPQIGETGKRVRTVTL